MTAWRRITAGLALAIGLAQPGPLRADEWDAGGDNDNGPDTDNLLSHAAVQVHDLARQGAVADQDWLVVTSDSFSSYQVLLDGVTGDLDLTTASLQRLAGDGVQVLQNAVVPDAGVLSVVWEEGAIGAAARNFIRVSAAACGSDCNSRDRYRVRLLETTYTVPRFNNSGTQTTVLLIKNVTDRGCLARCYFFAADNVLLGTTALGFNPGELHVVPPGAQPAGQAGSVRVAHTCGYGGLSGKAVSVEPSTGFTFDTPMAPRPR